MRKEYSIINTNIDLFKKKLILYGNQFQYFTFLDSNNFVKNNTEYTYYEYDFIAAIGSINEIKLNKDNEFDKLSEFNKNNKDWIFGHLSYDLKNELEKLESNNIDELNFPCLHFYIPKIVVTCKNENIIIHYLDTLQNKNDISDLLAEINSIEVPNQFKNNVKVDIRSRLSKEEYIKTVEKLKGHIQRGDIYEINFCQEFYCNSEINPATSYLKLKQISPTPFSCYHKINNHYLLSASPERFLKKNRE